MNKHKQRLTAAAHPTDVGWWRLSVAADQVVAELEKAVERPDVVIHMWRLGCSGRSLPGVAAAPGRRRGCCAERASVARIPLPPAVMFSTPGVQLIHSAGVKTWCKLCVTDNWRKERRETTWPVISFSRTLWIFMVPRGRFLMTLWPPRVSCCFNIGPKFLKLPLAKKKYQKLTGRVLQSVSQLIKYHQEEQFDLLVTLKRDKRWTKL